MGNIERIDQQLAELHGKRRELERTHDSLATAGALLGAPSLAQLMPAVRVHRGYGGRGYLVDWLKVVLQAAGPSGLETRTLVYMAAERFGLSFPSAKDRQRFFDNSLVRALRRLADAGFAERLHDPKTACATGGRWRWKLPPSLQELQADAREQR